jgi:uncharacterized protein YaiE (UPF0345 family)
MILEEETFEAFRYYPRDLTRRSGKPVKATCDNCRKVRITSKHDYHNLCLSCAAKGNTHALGFTHTERAKARIGTAQKGNTNLLGYKFTEEQRGRVSAALKGKYMGEDNWNYKDGEKASWARNNAKRKRRLGYTLLMPLTEGEVGHHITDRDVIGIPKEVHEKLCGYGRKKHRMLVLQWLKANDKKKYKRVLCVLAKEILK